MQNPHSIINLKIQVSVHDIPFTPFPVFKIQCQGWNIAIAPERYSLRHAGNLICLQVIKPGRFDGLIRDMDLCPAGIYVLRLCKRTVPSYFWLRKILHMEILKQH